MTMTELKVRPRDPVYGLTETRHANSVLPGQLRERLAGSKAPSAVKYSSGREFGVSVSLPPDHRIVADPVQMVLVHGSPAKVGKRIVKFACWTMPPLSPSSGARTDECREHKHVHAVPRGVAVPAERDHQVAVLLENGGKLARLLASAHGAMRKMPAPYSPEVRYFVPVLEARNREPAFPIGGWRGWVECFLGKGINRKAHFSVVPCQRYPLFSAGLSPQAHELARDRTPAAASGVDGAVQAAHSALVADLVQIFPSGNGQPPFCAVAGRPERLTRSHCGLLGRSWRSGPGCGVGSTVRAAITYLLILADSLANSALIGPGGA